jgi:hypothetical protein
MCQMELVGIVYRDLMRRSRRLVCVVALKRYVVFQIIFRQRISKFSVFIVIISAVSEKGFRHYGPSRPDCVLTFVSRFRDAFS